jgi:hypothetical protein
MIMKITYFSKYAEKMILYQVAILQKKNLEESKRKVIFLGIIIFQLYLTLHTISSRFTFLSEQVNGFHIMRYKLIFFLEKYIIFFT